jgi:hypothetical protein
MSLRRRSPLVAAVCVAALAVPATAGAKTYTVASGGDSGPGTLRQAILDANAHPNGSAADVINFSTAMVTAATGMPPVKDPVVFNGCSGSPSSTLPCATLDGSSAGSPNLGLDDKSDGVTIKGLAFTSWVDMGVRLAAGRSGLKVQTSGFKDDLVGVALLGSAAKIGGSKLGQGNYFAGNLGAVLIDGGDDNRVLGNRFGYDSTGAADGNVYGVDVRANADPALRTVIGGVPTPAEAATTVCDGACNVISNSSSAGVTMELGAPPKGMTIAGNQIGINEAGTGAAGNDVAVAVGSAKKVVIVQNVIAASTDTAVQSAAGVKGLQVVANLFGLDPSGHVALPNQQNAASMGGGVFSLNRVGGGGPSSGGVAVDSGASFASVSNNVFGIGVGGEDRGLNTRALEIQGSGQSVAGNTIGYMNGPEPAMALDGASNVTVTGNRIGVDTDGTTARPNEADGILVYNFAHDNVIGGNDGATENVLANNTTVATSARPISVINASGIAILRNRGTANTRGPFIDLFPPTGAGNDPTTGANNGIQAPAIGTVTGSGVSGTGARAGAKIRVYTAPDSLPKDITGFLGQTTADGSGNWTVTVTVPNVPYIAVNQTDTSGNTSEFATMVPN